MSGPATVTVSGGYGLDFTVGMEVVFGQPVHGWRRALRLVAEQAFADGTLVELVAIVTETKAWRRLRSWWRRVRPGDVYAITDVQETTLTIDRPLRVAPALGDRFWADQ